MKQFLRSMFLATTVAVCSIGTFVMPLTALSVVTLSTTGCEVSAAQVKADGAAIAPALRSIAALEPAMATQLNASADGIVAATANWTSGSATNVINSLAAGAEALLSGIDPNSPAAVFVAIAVTAMDVLLASIPPPTVTVDAVKVHTTPMKVYTGPRAVIKHHRGHSPEYDFKTTWNDAVKANPTLHVAPIQ